MNTIKTVSGVVIAGVLASVAAAAFAADPPAAKPEARIPFADHHGISGWQVVNDRTLLIEGQNRVWYKATLMSSCLDLPFSEAIGFKTNPDGSFDKFSSIRLRHQTCPLISLVKTDPPKKKATPAKPAKPAKKDASAQE